MTRYISTRGEAPTLGFCDVMLTGLARDGGLYVPETWPQLSSSAKAGDPVRRGFSVLSLSSLEYWVARLNRAMTAEHVAAFSRHDVPEL